MSREDFEKYIGELTPGVKNLLRKMAIYIRETSQRVDSDSEIENDSSPSQSEAEESKPADPSSASEQ
jgi:hypothetical protein